jgi:Protein of unknown function (DUF2946)
MKWIRSHISRGSWAALFALTLQFALSFGHFHGVAQGKAAAVALGSFSSERSLVDNATSTLSVKQHQPERNSDDHTDDICAICVVMAMANTALSATSPVLQAPQAIEFSYPALVGESARIASVRVAFQPRAPPIS